MSLHSEFSYELPEALLKVLASSQISSLCERVNKLGDDSTTRFVSLSIPYENLDPLAVLEIAGNPEGFRYFWEHPDQDISLAASGVAAVFKARGRDRTHSLHRKTEAFLKRCIRHSSITHSLSGPIFLGGASFHEQSNALQWATFGNAAVTVPEWIFIRNGQLGLLTFTFAVEGFQSEDMLEQHICDLFARFDRVIKENITDCQDYPDSNGCRQTCTVHESDANKKRWFESVKQAKTLIESGNFEKIVLARELKITSEKQICATRFLHQLRREYPSCYTFLIQSDKHNIFLGATPEKLFSLERNALKTEALAGTTSRGKTATQDTLLEKRLQNSAKDREEHSYVIDAIVSKISPFAHNIEVAEQPTVRKYTNVQHLYTGITATLSSDQSPLELVRSLHPTPAVGGHPQEIAVPHIQQLEQFDRGWYAGPIGWFTTNNRAEFSVALRCGLIQHKKITFFAGCGIVEDSDPQTEWEETKLKLMPMINALNHATN